MSTWYTLTELSVCTLGNAKTFFTPVNCNCPVDSLMLFDQRATRYYQEGEWRLCIDSWVGDGAHRAMDPGCGETTFMQKDGSLNDAAPAPEVDSGGASSDVFASEGQDPGGPLAAGDDQSAGGLSAAEDVTSGDEANPPSKEKSLRLEVQSIAHMLTHKTKEQVLCDLRQGKDETSSAYAWCVFQTIDKMG